NNAGINPLSEINEVCPDILEQVLTVNLKAPILLLKGFVPKMKQKGYGRIVNISSVWGIVSKAGRVQYSASKFGINGVTKTLAVELGPNGILINSVCPGFTNTEMTIQNLSHEQMSELCREIPLGRFAEPCEIAELVAFLVSDKNTYITGQVIAADGGFTVR
ncbi:MAG: SDR family oxidoreductase, partial [Clostridiales bacterium]|nr:SDR family oxidoreductase [Clostridiales bacterium]